MREFLIHGAAPSQLYSVLFSAAIIINCIDISHQIFWNRRYIKEFFRKYFFGDRPFIVTSGTRFLQLPVSISCIIIAFTNMLEPSCDNYKEIYLGVYTVTMFFMVNSMLYILQVFAKTSYLLSVIQKMMSETAVFVVVAFLPYLSFALVFAVLGTPFSCIDSRINATAFNEQQIPGSLYRTLMRLVNVKTPDDILFTNSNVPALSMIVYMLAILMWPLMLLNPLMALYNDKMQEITTHKGVISAVQNLNVMLFVHDSYYAPFMKLKHAICKTRVSPKKPGETIYVVEEIIKK